MAFWLVNIFQSRFNYVTRVDKRLDVFCKQISSISTIWQYHRGVFFYFIFYLFSAASPLENSVDFELEMSYHAN